MSPLQYSKYCTVQSLNQSTDKKEDIQDKLEKIADHGN